MNRKPEIQPRLLDKLARSRVLWLLSGVFPLIVFAIILLTLFTQQQEQAIRQLLGQAAVNSAHVVDRTISEQVGLLNGLAATHALDIPDFQAFRLDAERLWQMHPEWRTVILTDSKQPIFNLAIPPGQLITPLRDPASLQRVFDSGKPSIGNLAHGYVAVRVPVIRKGRVRYTLVAPVDPHHFLDALNSSWDYRQWQIMIVGSDRAVLAASSQAPVRQGERLPVAFLQEGQDSPLKMDNQLFAPPVSIRSGTWKVIVFAGEDSITAPFLKRRQVVYLGGMVSAALTMILVVMLSSSWAARQEAIRLHREIEERRRMEKALQASEEKFRTTLNSIGDAIISTDFQGNITHLNPIAETLTGWPAAEALGKPLNEVFRIVDEESRLVIADPVTKVLEMGNIVGLGNHTLLLARNGLQIPIADSGAPIRDDQGEITGVVLVFRDQTEERSYRKRISDSERRYRSLYDSIRDAIVVTDMDSTVLDCNPAFIKLFGYTLGELRGKQFTMVFSDQGEFGQLDERLTTLADAAGLQMTIRYRRKNGETFPGETNLFPLQDSDSGLLRYIGLVRDIADRLEAEEALRESEQRFRQLVENAPEGIFVETGSRFAYLNREAAKLFGAEAPEDLLASSILHRFPADRQQAILEQFRLVDQERKPIASKREICLQLDTTQIPVEISAVPMEYGGFRGALVFVRDMTEVLRAQTRQKELEDQLFQSQKLEAIGRLAGGIAHDFNNLLSIILGYGELTLQDLPEDDSQREAALEIHDAALRAKELTRQLLAFSRKQILEMKTVDINRIVIGFEKLLRRLIGEDIELHVTLGDGPILVKADITQLEQVMMNLAVNARDAMPEGGLLTIRTCTVGDDEAYARRRLGSKPGNYAMIGVSDTGLGMDSATLDKIFEPFFTTKSKDKGTGLGLATVFGIIRQHDGNIRVDSEPGRGTTFKIYLPLNMEDVTTDETVFVPAKPVCRLARILVVEDDSSLRRLICSILEKSGYRVIESTTVEDAVIRSHSHSGKIDLVLTDVIMPRMKGSEVYVKVLEANPSAKVLYMSGYTDEVIVHHGILKEGVALIQKPFAARDLLARLEGVLRGN